MRKSKLLAVTFLCACLYPAAPAHSKPQISEDLSRMFISIKPDFMDLCLAQALQRLSNPKGPQAPKPASSAPGKDELNRQALTGMTQILLDKKVRIETTDIHHSNTEMGGYAWSEPDKDWIGITAAGVKEIRNRAKLKKSEAIEQCAAYLLHESGHLYLYRHPELGIADDHKWIHYMQQRVIGFRF